MTTFDLTKPLDPMIWGRNFHPPTGQAQHAYDGPVVPTPAGLAMTATKDAAGVFHIATIDTKPVSSKHPGFVQLYGHFEAEVLMPKVAGMWGAFWLYGNGTDAAGSWVNELDVCEPLGSDPTRDRVHIHFRNPDGSDGSLGAAVATGHDLTLAPHLYAADWRKGVVDFFLDGTHVYRIADSRVPSHPLPLILDLSVGGPGQKWAGYPLASFRSATMTVRRVTVTP